MKNQESLKVYSAYLPYGVKLVDDEYKDIHTLFTVCSNDSIVVKNNEDKGVDILMYGDFKLLLRPLSDLTKEIEHNGEKFVPLDYLYSKSYPIDYFEYKYHHDYFFSWIESKDKSHHVKFLPHGLIKQLQEWHFDVFGLLDKNLAINLNKLQK